MRKIILSMQMTLDGYVCGPNDEMDWIYNGGDEWGDMQQDMDSSDTFLLGAKMYPGYSEYWQKVLTDPNANPDEKKFAQVADKTQHIVFSRSMQHADWDNTRIARDVDSEIAKLKQEEGKNMLLWGGASLAQYFIAKGLVDEVRLTIVPVLLGAGKKLFPDDGERRKLELVSAKQLNSGAVVVRLRRGE